MMTMRCAIIIGSYLTSHDRPSHQKVRAILDRWTALFRADTYGFRSLANTSQIPVPLVNPDRVGDITDLLEAGRGLPADTELLIYFLGHSVSEGERDLKLILSKTDKSECSITLSYLIENVRNLTPIRRLIVVLDSCHAGRARDTLRSDGFDVFAMFAAGTNYAFDAEFSDALLRALEQPIQKSDQRIDRRAGGITYQKIFEDARRRVLLSGNRAANRQDPRSTGEYGVTVLHPVTLEVQTPYNSFASNRSIYARVFRLLKIISDRNPGEQELRDAVAADRLFLLKQGESGDGRCVSRERIAEYLTFLTRVHWVVQPAGRYRLTEDGDAAKDDLFFNRLLLEAIERHIFPKNVNFHFLEETVKELLSDMIPSTPARIKERAAMKGIVIELDEAMRLAIQLLPSTGRFLKGSADAIYPAEL